MSNGRKQTFTYVIPEVRGRVENLRIFTIKAERDEPWKCRSLENDYVKAFTCKTCSGIASAGATSNDENLSMLLRVLRRRKRDKEERVGRPLGGKEGAWC
jgi:hypothetical protein